MIKNDLIFCTISVNMPTLLRAQLSNIINKETDNIFPADLVYMLKSY